ncbi:MAG: hypothetical protein A2W25_02555 [candidate division Zixibacteria bacterium RBG_16_53_22]|nr:MAG: hypothetical protein A2W25_02555 [candidate division Zixibacteria bacterium RBG_16_53_22]
MARESQEESISSTSNPGRPPGPASSPLSGKTLTPEIACRDYNLLSLWGGVFYHPVFVSSGARVLKLRGEPRYISRDGMPGVSNVLYHNRPGITVATLPLMFQYFGPLTFAPAEEPSSGCRILFALPDQIDYAYFSLPPSIDTSRIPRNWRIHPQRTLVVDRQGLGLWGNFFRDDVKNKIRKGRREKVIISQTSRLPKELWDIAYARKSLRAPIDPSALEQWCDELVAASLLTIHVASIDGKPVAFRGQLVFGEYAYDWIAGSDPQYHSTGANQLLMAEIGDEISKMNLYAWDLVGGQVESIADFKKSFGAAEVVHYHVSAALTPKGRLYSALRKLRYGFWRRS